MGDLGDYYATRSTYQIVLHSRWVVAAHIAKANAAEVPIRLQPLPNIGIEAVAACNIGVRARRRAPAAGVDLVAAEAEQRSHTEQAV